MTRYSLNDVKGFNMNPVRRLLPALFLMVLIACIPAITAFSYGASVPAARINGTEISRAEYRQELQRVARGRGVTLDAMGEEAESKLKRQVLDHLVARELLFQESVKTGIRVTDDEVGGQIERLRKEFKAGQEFASALEGVGLDEERLRGQIARGISIQRYIDRTIAAGITVTDDESRRYYDEHHDEFTEPLRVKASHILLTDADGDTALVREKLEGIRKRISAGESFAELARTQSRCLSRERGGDIGYVRPGELAPEMEKVVLSLAKGELSGIVEDRFGHHLVMVTDATPGRVRPYGEVAASISERIRQDKATRQVARQVKALRKKARVEVLLDGDEK